MSNGCKLGFASLTVARTQNSTGGGCTQNLFDGSKQLGNGVGLEQYALNLAPRVRVWLAISAVPNTKMTGVLM